MDPHDDQELGQICCGVLESFVSDTLTMVNSIGLLEDEDTQLSSPGAPRQDKSYDGEDSFESIPEGDEEDSDGYNDAEEVRPTYWESFYGHLSTFPSQI